MSYSKLRKGQLSRNMCILIITVRWAGLQCVTVTVAFLDFFLDHFCYVTGLTDILCDEIKLA